MQLYAIYSIMQLYAINVCNLTVCNVTNVFKFTWQQLLQVSQNRSWFVVATKYNAKMKYKNKQRIIRSTRNQDAATIFF